MTAAPVLLDLFGCEGGAAAGYAQAGWEVWSVEKDHRRAKYNPHSWFVGDWADGLTRALDTGRVRAVHASPPCKAYTRLGHLATAQGHIAGEGMDLYAEVRDRLTGLALPWVIENVEGSPLPTGSLMLCGSEFGLHVQRHRLFESSEWLMGAGGCAHGIWPGQPWGIYGRTAGDRVPGGGRVAHGADHARALLGIAHRMTWTGCTQALPPAYTRFIGEQLADRLGLPVAA